jgi:hypothetical protein
MVGAVGTALQLAVVFDGQVEVKWGAVVSTTVIVWVHVLEFEQASVALQVLARV